MVVTNSAFSLSGEEEEQEVLLIKNGFFSLQWECDDRLERKKSGLMDKALKKKDPLSCLFHGQALRKICPNKKKRRSDTSCINICFLLN